MPDSPIAAIELHHVALPTRREHKWAGLTEPIGGYVLVKMIDAAGLAGWGEAPALKDWGGDFGRYFGESPGTTIEVVTRHLAPAVRGALPGEIADLHARMDRAIKGYPYAKAAVARAGGIICNVNGSVETGIGNLANLQLAAAAPAVVLSCVVPVSTPAEAQSGQIAGIYYKDDLIAEPMRLNEGAIELPTASGMGIAADEEKIRRYCVAAQQAG